MRAQISVSTNFSRTHIARVEIRYIFRNKKKTERVVDASLRTKNWKEHDDDADTRRRFDWTRKVANYIQDCINRVCVVCTTCVLSICIDIFSFVIHTDAPHAKH